MRGLTNYVLIPLTFIGALNWGLIGIFGFDLVAFLFGPATLASNIIYAIIGISERCRNSKVSQFWRGGSVYSDYTADVGEVIIRGRIRVGNSSKFPNAHWGDPLLQQEVWTLFRLPPNNQFWLYL